VVLDDVDRRRLGHPIVPDVFSRRFTRLRERLGIRADVRLHDLRVMFVTEAIGAGVPLAIVSKAAGHSSSAFTADRYGRPGREDARLVADALDAAIGGGSLDQRSEDGGADRPTGL
jgi:integrase